MTQSLAYKIIRKVKMGAPAYKKMLDRKSTKRNMGYATAAAASDESATPTAERIWKSTKHKDVLTSARFFLWMLIHDGYKVGRHWEKIELEGHEHKGICSVCGQGRRRLGGPRWDKERGNISVCGRYISRAEVNIQGIYNKEA
jgi:ribonuclease HI